MSTAYSDAPLSTIKIDRLKDSRFLLPDRRPRELPYRDDEGRVNVNLLRHSQFRHDQLSDVPPAVTEALEEWVRHAERWLEAKKKNVGDTPAGAVPQLATATVTEVVGNKRAGSSAASKAVAAHAKKHRAAAKPAPPTQASSALHPNGSRVNVRFDDGNDYPGTVTGSNAGSANDDVLYSIEFDDGDKLDDVAEEEMRRIPTVVEVDTEDEEDADYQDDDEEDEDDEEESEEESEEEEDDDLPDDQLHMSSKNQTGYLGVKVLRGKGADKWNKEKHRYVAQIQRKGDNSQTSVGTYKTPRRAAVAYARALAEDAAERESELAKKTLDGTTAEGYGRALTLALPDLPDECLHWSSSNASGFVGVKIIKGRKWKDGTESGAVRYEAYLQRGGFTSIGSYKEARQAAIAYARALAAIEDGKERLIPLLTNKPGEGVTEADKEDARALVATLTSRTVPEEHRQDYAKKPPTPSPHKGAKGGGGGGEGGKRGPGRPPKKPPPLLSWEKDGMATAAAAGGSLPMASAASTIASTSSVRAAATSTAEKTPHSRKVFTPAGRCLKVWAKQSAAQGGPSVEEEEEEVMDASEGGKMQLMESAVGTAEDILVGGIAMCMESPRYDLPIALAKPLNMSTTAGDCMWKLSSIIHKRGGNNEEIAGWSLRVWPRMGGRQRGADMLFWDAEVANGARPSSCEHRSYLAVARSLGLVEEEEEEPAAAGELEAGEEEEAGDDMGEDDGLGDMRPADAAADDDDGNGSPGRSSDDEMEEALARSMESSPEGVK